MSRRPADVKEMMHVAMLVLIHHPKSSWRSCPATPRSGGCRKRIVILWERGVGMAPSPLFEAEASLTFHQLNSPLVSVLALLFNVLVVSSSGGNHPLGCLMRATLRHELQAWNDISSYMSKLVSSKCAQTCSTPIHNENDTIQCLKQSVTVHKQTRRGIRRHRNLY